MLPPRRKTITVKASANQTRNCGRILLSLGCWIGLVSSPLTGTAASDSPPSNAVVSLQLQPPRIKVPEGYRPYLRSGCLWQGEADLHGHKWLVGAFEPPGTGGQYTPIWQWLLQSAEPTDPPRDNPAWTFSCLPYLFVDGHAYRLDNAFEGAGKDRRLKLTFTEDAPKLTELRVRGTDIRRLQFYGKYVALVENPSPVIRLPADTYTLVQITVGRANSTPWFMSSSNQTVRASETNGFVLNAGGPLTNRVSFDRRNRSLRLNYELVGADGRAYLAVDRGRAPRFTVYRDDRAVASGAFEFG